MTQLDSDHLQQYVEPPEPKHDSHTRPQIPDLPSDSLQQLPKPPPLDVPAGGAGSGSSNEKLQHEPSIESSPADTDSLSVRLTKRAAVDEASISEFLSGLKKSSDDDREVPTLYFAVIVFPMIFCAVVSLVLLVLVGVNPVNGGGSSAVSLKIAVTIFCSLMLVSSLCVVCTCCVGNWISVCCLDHTSPGKLSFGEGASWFLGVGGMAGCLLFSLCTLSALITAGVLGSTLHSLALSSAISWAVFGILMTTCLVFICGGATLCVGVVGLTIAASCDCCESFYDCCIGILDCVQSLAPKCFCVLTCGCMSESCLKKAILWGKLRSHPCLRSVAQEFVHQNLQIDEGWFNEVRCYCHRCWVVGNFPDSQTRGEKIHAVPRLWTRFLLPPVRAAKVRGLDKWHLAYHGTSGLSAKAIIESQRMLLPGDRRPDGGVIEIRPGHIGDESFARNVFMSPSVVYVSSPVYCSVHDFQDKVGRKFEIRIALEVLIQPDTYEVGPETIGAKASGVDIIDKLFSNQELEWFTNRRGVIEVSALLVKVTKQEETNE